MLSRTARIYGNLLMILLEVKLFEFFVARMGEGKGQILTMTQGRHIRQTHCTYRHFRLLRRAELSGTVLFGGIIIYYRMLSNIVVYRRG
jgi:hypothetical protein